MQNFSGQTQTEYLEQANDSLLTIVQIETKEALENVGSSPELSGKSVILKISGG